MRDLCGGETVQYLDYGGGYMNLSMIKLYRTTYVHIYTQTQMSMSKVGKSD